MTRSARTVGAGTSDGGGSSGCRAEVLLDRPRLVVWSGQRVERHPAEPVEQHLRPGERVAGPRPARCPARLEADHHPGRQPGQPAQHRERGRELLRRAPLPAAVARAEEEEASDSGTRARSARRRPAGSARPGTARSPPPARTGRRCPRRAASASRRSCVGHPVGDPQEPGHRVAGRHVGGGQQVEVRLLPQPRSPCSAAPGSAPPAGSACRSPGRTRPARRRPRCGVGHGRQQPAGQLVDGDLLPDGRPSCCPGRGAGGRQDPAGVAVRGADPPGHPVVVAEHRQPDAAVVRPRPGRRRVRTSSSCWSGFSAQPEIRISGFSSRTSTCGGCTYRRGSTGRPST